VRGNDVRIAIIVGCLLAALLAACGSGKTAAQKKAEFQTAAEKATDMATLQLSDLPAGWSVKPPEADTPDDKAFADEFKKCSKLPDDADNSLDPVKKVDDTSFKGPKDQDLSTGPSVYETVDRAQDVLNLITAAYSNCGRNFTDLFRKAFLDGITQSGGNPDALDLSVTIADRNIPKLGDSARGFRLTLDERRSHTVLYIEFQFFRVGHINADVITSVSDAQQDDLDALPKLVEAKLRAADATLPK
jgi:hypothetical protein